MVRQRNKSFQPHKNSEFSEKAKSRCLAIDCESKVVQPETKKTQMFNCCTESIRNATLLRRFAHTLGLKVKVRKLVPNIHK